MNEAIKLKCKDFLMILLKTPASALQFSANKLLVQKVLSVFQQPLSKTL
jgi:hypothetical protein